MKSDHFLRDFFLSDLLYLFNNLRIQRMQRSSQNFFTKSTEIKIISQHSTSVNQFNFDINFLINELLENIFTNL